ncbi:ZN638 protein, partial [Smithornis capensis]|nr:ZN638 protein [Smithornis capensis]
KKCPEGPGLGQRAAADPPGEPREAKKGADAASGVPEEIPARQTEPESQPAGAAREAPGSLAQSAPEDVDAGIGVPVAPVTAAGTRSPGEGVEEALPPSREEVPEAHPEPKSSGSVSEKETEEEELPAPAVEPLESSSKDEGDPAGRGMILAAGEPAGGSPGAVSPGPGDTPGDTPMDVVAPPVTQPAGALGDPEKHAPPEAVKANPETCVTPVADRKPVPRTGEDGKRPDVAGAEGEAGAEESVLRAGHAAEDKPGKLVGKAGAEPEKPLGKAAARAGAALESTAGAVGGSSTGSSSRAHQSRGTGPAKPEGPVTPLLSLKEPAVGKTLLRAVVSIPDIFKPRGAGKSNEPSLCKGGEQKPLPRAEPRGQAGAERRPPRAAAPPGAGGSQGRGNGASGVEGQGGNGRNSSQQDKDSQVDSRAGSKQCQEGESGTAGTKEDPGSNQGPVGDGRGGAGSSGKQKEEEELFPFNLDEFVTVDEVVEEVESPVAPRRNPPRGKRKDNSKASASEPVSKRRRGKSSGAKGEPSFVTLDEIGGEEDAPAPPVDPRGLVVVDEVLEEEELAEAVKDPQALLTLDEISEQEEPRAQSKERELKAEPLVTVDEIGEVEELPLNEPAELGGDAEHKGSHVPDDPSALLTVDELQEDTEDNPLLTLDEVDEEEDDFLADFNHLKEELNFVTVDEVGDDEEEEEEEEENTSTGKNLPKSEDDEDIVAVAGPEEEEMAASAAAEEEDIVAVAGPEEIGILGDTNPEEETIGMSKPKGEDPQGQDRAGGGRGAPGPSQPIPTCLSPAAQVGSGDVEPESRQKKAAAPGAPKVQSTPKALDILVPKAGFFCQICCLFYADEPSMITHCRTPLHRHNME